MPLNSMDDVSQEPPDMFDEVNQLRSRPRRCSRGIAHNPARSGLRVSVRAATRAANRISASQRVAFTDNSPSSPSSPQPHFSAMRRLFRIRRRAESVMGYSEHGNDDVEVLGDDMSPRSHGWKLGISQHSMEKSRAGGGASVSQSNSDVLSHETLDYASSEAVEEHHRTFARHHHKLKCLEFGEFGETMERFLSRQDIIEEAVAASSASCSHPRNASKRSVMGASRNDIDVSRRQDQKRMERRTRNLRNKTLERAAAHASGARRPIVPRDSRLASRNDLTLRDLRQVDPSFTAKAAIWVRQNALVVSVDAVRAIILYNKMLLFDPDNAKVQKPIKYIKQRLAVGARNAEEVFMPFEFRALEGILIYSCILLEHEFSGIHDMLKETLERLPLQINAEHMEQLRQQEQKLNHFYAKSRKLQYVLQSVLDEDEDMASMYLTEKHKAPEVTRNPVDHDEAEMLLETYLQVVDDLTSKAGLMNRAIDDTENLIEIHLDTMQNHLLLVNLLITITSTIFTFGTCVTSIFGMNLPFPDAMTNLPSSQYFFWGLVACLAVILVINLIVLTKWSNRQGLYLGRYSRHGREQRQDGKGVSAVGRTKELVSRLLDNPSDDGK